MHRNIHVIHSKHILLEIRSTHASHKLISSVRETYFQILQLPIYKRFVYIIFFVNHKNHNKDENYNLITKKHRKFGQANLVERMLLFKRAQLYVELTVSFIEFRQIWCFGSRKKKNIAYQRFFQNYAL